MNNRKFRSNYRPREKQEETAQDREILKSDMSGDSDTIGQNDDRYREVLPEREDSDSVTEIDEVDSDENSYRVLDDEGRYIDATGDPVDEDYDEQERLQHMRDAEELFRRILDFDPEEDDDSRKRRDESEEIAQALEDLLETIVQGADEIGQLIRDGIDEIISVI